MILFKLEKKPKNTSSVTVKKQCHNFGAIFLMNRTQKNLVLKDLCPDGIWQLTDVMKSVLRYHISRLPNRKVSEDETRYPQSPADMRAFLVKFFVRHYLQIQNSLLDYMTSKDFLETIEDRHLRILDVG